MTIFFLVMNFLDYVSTIILYKQGHIELNQFINVFLQKDMIMELFIMKVIFISAIFIVLIIAEKMLEDKYIDNKFIVVAPLSFSIILLVISIFMSLVVINNTFVIAGMGGFVCQ